jgi:hypothetical protein
MSNLTNNQKRYLFYWLWFLVHKFAAVIVLGTKYGFFSSETTKETKISLAVLLTAVWIIFGFWDHFAEWARDLQEGFFRELMVSLAQVFLPAILWGAGLMAKVVLDQYLFFTGTILITTLFGVVLRAFHLKYRRQVLIKEQGYVNVLK